MAQIPFGTLAEPMKWMLPAQPKAQKPPAEPAPIAKLPLFD